MDYHRMIAATLAVRHLTGTGRVKELAEATLELEDAKAEFDKRCEECGGFGILLSDTGPAPVETVCEPCGGTGNMDWDDLGAVYPIGEMVDD